MLNFLKRFKLFRRPSPDSITVEVTYRDYAKAGSWYSPSSCPLATTLNRTFNKNRWVVGGSYAVELNSFGVRLRAYDIKDHDNINAKLQTDTPCTVVLEKRN